MVPHPLRRQVQLFLYRSLRNSLVILLGGFSLGLPLAATAQNFIPPNRGLPGRREGGGTRGCTFGTPGHLLALLPETNLGLTTQANPRFMWYTPLSQAELVEFSLYATNPEQPQDRQLVYQATLSITGENGIASLELPIGAGVPPLEIGQAYQWTVALVCDATDRRSNLQVQGWVQRVEVDSALAAELAETCPRDRIALYAQNGLWFDALNTLVDLRRAYPEDAGLGASWLEFLGSVGLDAIADEPLFPLPSDE